MNTQAVVSPLPKEPLELEMDCCDPPQLIVVPPLGKALMPFAAQLANPPPPPPPPTFTLTPTVAVLPLPPVLLGVTLKVVVG